MSNRLRNVSINGSRTDGQIVIPPNQRKCLGLVEFDGSALPANTVSVTPSYDDVGIWQLTPLLVPMSIAAVQVYFVGTGPVAGNVGFQLLMNQGQQYLPAQFISSAHPTSTLIYERGAYTSQNTTDYWWLYYQTSPDWVPGSSLITFGVWIYDGLP